MYIVPEREIAGLMTREAAFSAVEQVFAAMASGDANNFPVIREAIGHEDALYGFKGGFDQAGLTLGLKAGGYWPNNLEKRGIINHQSTVFLFDPDTGKAKAMVGGEPVDCSAYRRGVVRFDQAPCARRCQSDRYDRCGPSGHVPASRRT